MIHGPCSKSSEFVDGYENDMIDLVFPSLDLREPLPMTLSIN